jgi:hypothetical protein
MEKAEGENGWYSMGVDTGSALHVVVLRHDLGREEKEAVVYLGECREFEELDALMKRFNVGSCVIDGLPETHSTREFARRHAGKVHLCFFQENQRGGPNWNTAERNVTVNRTEALDASRAAIRQKLVVLPRRDAVVEKFAQHMTCDAKVLDEDEETGTKKYRYVKTGVNHFSFAFTYAWLATQTNSSFKTWMHYFEWMKQRNVTGL